PLNEVRWLSRPFAVSALMRNYKVLAEYCTEQVNGSSDPIHKYCLKKLKDPQYHIALATNDVLGELAELCSFQRSSLTTIEAHQLAKAKISKLYAQYLSESDEVNTLFAAETVDTALIMRFLNGSSRFPEDELKEWAAFDQAALPHADFELVTKYAVVIEKPEVNIHTEILKQYSDFKFVVAERIKTEAIKTFADLVSFSLQEEQLLDVCASFQASSVDCECRFSMMNIIKTESWSRLEVDHLDKLMRIKSYLTAGDKINLDTVYNYWKLDKDRRDK
uniref:Uncharacterized protein n=1 Tax=Latimeria chalumnae TaxID=7897 RepID=H3ACD3_LATCH